MKLGDTIAKEGIFVDGDWVESKDQDPNGEVRLIQLADIGGIEFRNKSDRYLTYKKALELNCTFLEKGDLLIARMPDPLGRACIFPLKGKEKYITVVDVAIVRVDEKKVDNNFLCYLINAPQSRNSISSLQSGSTRKRISRKNLGTIDFPLPPLPPLPEQKKIVAKLEELFSGLDSGAASLKKAKEQIKLYRQSVLASAFSGRLVGQRTEGKVQSEILKAAEPKVEYNNNGLPEGLPAIALAKAGWKWVKLGELISPSKERFEPLKNGNKKYIGLEHIEKGTGTVLGYADSNTVRSTKTVFNKGDLLYGKLRPYLNKVIVAEFHGVCSTDILVFNKQDGLSNSFLKYRMLMEDFVSYAQNNMSGVQHPRINFKSLSEYELIIPSHSEQNKIVEEIEKRFSEADNLERAIDESLGKSEALRQSILKQAFEGRLV